MRLLSADHVIPVSVPPIADGAVLVNEGIIEAVGPTEDLRKEFPGVSEERFPSAAILPGFVNCHSHLELTALRGSLDRLDDNFAAWLLKITGFRDGLLSDQDLKDSALAGAAEALKAGVTCLGDIGRAGWAGLEAVTGLGLRGVVYQETSFSPDDSSADEASRALFEKVHHLREDENGLVRVGISPHSPYTVSASLMRLIAQKCMDEGLPVTIHAAESDDEQNLLTRGEGFFSDIYRQFGVSWKSPGLRAVEYLERTGILETRPLLAHCTTADEKEISIIASTRSKVAHCPKSNAKFGHGVAPLSVFLKAGIAVGLGSDSMVSNNLCDMIEEARFAALVARTVSPDDPFVHPAEALRMATLGGAEAMGIGDLTGSLEIGKSADLAVVSLEDVSRLPVNDVESAIVFGSSAGDVKMTMVNGEDLYIDGKVRGLDEPRLSGRLKEIGDRLTANA